ncbi:deoxynucleoside kinase [Patescibacteria group bacterium]|nr:deoxynucleoside kinase [Patescibacteria group bacterium]
MSKNKGKLIVIDGTDGSGKATQVAKLKERLTSEEYQVCSLDFPRYYDNFFGGFIGECLAGKHGNWAELDPKIASVVYAADRFESSAQIRTWLEEGSIVILDRYVSSNQIHQGGKIKDLEERRTFMSWLDTMEHEVFKIPRPDAILYLDVSVEITQKLLKKKSAQESKQYLDGEGDQHENNIEHLTKARESGLKMIAENNNWIRIGCSREGDIFSIDDIHEVVYRKALEIINS